MVTLKNPTDALVKMVYLGKEYSLAPMDSDTFSDDVAEFWIAIHQFLEVGASPVSEAPKVKEFVAKAPEKEEEKTILEEAIEVEVKEVKVEDFEIKPAKKVISKK